MEKVINIMLPFVVAILVCCSTCLAYVMWWHKKNPWYKDYIPTRLSAKQRAYRDNEQAKLSNVFLSCLIIVVFLALLSLISLKFAIAGELELDGDWMMVVPFIGVTIVVGVAVARKCNKNSRQ